MSVRRALAILAIAALSVVGSLSPTMAQAIMKGSSPVYAAPDAGSAQITTLAAGTPYTVNGCQNGWCQVSVGGTVGYVPQNIVGNSGQQAQPQPQPQPGNPGFSFDFNFGNNNNGYPNPGPLPPRRPRPPVYEKPEACFFSATNFRGSSFCVSAGDSHDDLDNWDDSIRSVQVFGGARVDLCRDEALSGTCVTLRSNQSRLPGQIDRRASSLEVY